MKRLLIFGPYSIVDAQHGGQLRAKAIVDIYRSGGYEVKYVGVYDKRFYPRRGNNDLALSLDNSSDIASILTSDIRSGKAIYENVGIREQVKSIISDFEPDIIEIEQAFPYFGLAKVLSELDWRKPLIYSSHNVEYELKEQILHNSGIADREIKVTVSELIKLEKELVRVSDLVITCSKTDSDKFKSWGAKNMVYAPNGTYKKKSNKNLVSRIREEYIKKGVDKLILFIGSAHPPNETGFMEMIGSKIGFLPPDAMILLVGGVSDLIKRRFSEDYRQYCTNLRIDFLGRVSNQKLAALLDLAAVVILPITEGGGSNIKTAEALLSGKKIVATPTALRAFDNFRGFPSVQLAKDGEEFRNAIYTWLNSPTLTLAKSEVYKLNELEWGNALKPILDSAGKL